MGMFSIFAKPLGWVLRWIYSLVPSYFVALLIFTVATRLVLFPLSIKNQKNQADRARLAPRLDRIQKKYGQDRQKMAMKQQDEHKEADQEAVPLTLIHSRVASLPRCFLRKFFQSRCKIIS